MMRRWLAAVLVVAGVLGGSVSGATATTATVEVDIFGRGLIVERGQAAYIGVKVRCPSGYEVLEALAYLSQDGEAGAPSYFPAACDGESHWHAVRVTPAEGRRFHRGPAQASAYVLVEQPASGDVLSGQATEIIRLRWRGR